MASRAISGKPGGGKSYYATKLVIDELITTERCVVTNLELREEGIVDYLSKRGRTDIDVYSRVVRISDEQVPSFWRYRGNGLVLPDVESSDIKNGVRPDVHSFGPGVHYFLDELHKFLNSRQWATTGPLLLWYISQHRHFGDDVTWITQHVQNVDKQFRSVTQDYTYVRNFGKEKFRGLTKGSSFRVSTYLEPFTGNQTAQESFSLKPDWKGIGACYHTSIAHGSADKGQKAKGFPVWILYAGVILVAVFVSVFFIFGPEAISRWMVGKQQRETAEVQARMRPAAVGNSTRVPVGGAPLDTPPIGGPDRKEQLPATIVIDLEHCSASEMVARFSQAGPLAGVSVFPSPVGAGVVVSGPSVQSVVVAADVVKKLDQASVTVCLQAVVLRRSTGRGSNVGVWESLREVVKGGGFGLGDVRFDPLTGVVTFGSVTAAQEVIRILGSQSVRRYGFSVENRPRLSVSSGSNATFSSGREIPVPVTTSNGLSNQTSVNFKAVQFSLDVRPSVLPSGRIVLEITQSNDDVIGTAQVGGDAVPTVATQRLVTRLELQPGQLAVLGGAEVRSNSDESRAVPVLGAVPPFSWIFGNRDKARESSELVVALTAYTLPNGLNPARIERAEEVKSISPEKSGKPRAAEPLTSSEKKKEKNR